MAQIDSSIVTLAYPTLQRHFRVSLGAVTWVGLAYLLTVVGTLVAFGRFSDMFGRKLVYVYGFVVFLLGSVLCGFAPNLWLLVASRVVQALGGAMIQANSVAIVVLVLPVASRTKGLGFQAAAQALGLAIGPTLGGLILGVASWRWLFFVNVPVGLVALGGGGAVHPSLEEPERAASDGLVGDRFDDGLDHRAVHRPLLRQHLWMALTADRGRLRRGPRRRCVVHPPRAASARALDLS